MKNYNFTAIDEKGGEYVFHSAVDNNIARLTLKKETFANAEKLFVLPDFAKAKAGDDGFYITPRSISMSGDVVTYFTEREDAEYEYGKPIMSMYGVKTPSVTALVRIERNYKYKFVTTVKNGEYNVMPMFDFTVNDTVYDDIRLEVVFLDATAGIADFAKAERDIRLERDEILTLCDKCKKPAAEYARKYPLVRIRMGWKPSPSPVLHQTAENEPEMYVACTFARVRDIADALKARGVKGIELQLVGWNISGHDGRFPQLLPVDERLGGEAELKKTIDYVKSLGYAISLHTNTIDEYEVADTFTWDDIAVDRDGNYLQIGHYSGGYAYHVCLEKQLKNAKRDLPDIAKFGLNGLHFTDVISIVEPDTCFAKDHPCTTADGIRLAKENMKFTSELFGGFSSEGCFDFALRELDYGLYVSFGHGFSTRRVSPFCSVEFPFYELTYHGVVLYNPFSPSVNYPIKPDADRLAFFMRGGRPSFYIYSKFRTGGKENWMGEIDLTVDNDTDLAFTADTIAAEAKWYEKTCDLQYSFMKNYEVLDNGIHIATYENGTRMIGNFSDKKQTYDSVDVESFDYIIL